jgi:putative membrane protein
MLKKLAALPALAFIVLIEPLQALAQQAAPQPQPPQGYYGPGPWHMWHGGYGHFWWMFPMMMLFFILVCGVIFFVGCRFSGHGPHCWGPHAMNRPWGDPSYSALQILNERLARGEIQKDEYAEKKTAILSSGRP